MSLFDQLQFSSGHTMKNRLALAPLTNTQSHEDGTLSEDELRFLRMRAEGGFGLVMTCASHVSANGKGFSGQLGCFSDDHREGLERIASAVSLQGALPVLQLHHAGMRSPAELIEGPPLCPSENKKHGARAMTEAEVHEAIDDFVRAAVRARDCGFAGVEIHGAHGYLLAQFLSPVLNQRSDDFGGSFDNRARIVFTIADRIRESCGEHFCVGLRLSPEMADLQMPECLELAQRAIDTSSIDFLDLSLWDVGKTSEHEDYQNKIMRSYFAELDRGDTKIGCAGKIYDAATARECIDEGYDFVLLGRAAILHHDFPKRAKADANFAVRALPVSEDVLHDEGLGANFVTYMRRWDGFVSV